jgi:hypothetical protein
MGILADILNGAYGGGSGPDMSMDTGIATSQDPNAQSANTPSTSQAVQSSAPPSFAQVHPMASQLIQGLVSGLAGKPQQPASATGAPSPNARGPNLITPPFAGNNNGVAQMAARIAGNSPGNSGSGGGGINLSGLLGSNSQGSSELPDNWADVGVG